MSEERLANIAKLTANVDELQDTTIETDSRIEDSLNKQDDIEQEGIRTQLAINRLEKAKEVATSDSVKRKLQEEIDAAKQRKAEETARKREQLETLQTAKNAGQAATNVVASVGGAISHTTGRINDAVTSAGRSIATVSTPGSILLPVTILLVFFLLLLPVNGYTRAQWLWMALIGDAKIKTSVGTEESNTPITGVGDIEQRTYTRQSYTNPYIRRG